MFKVLAGVMIVLSVLGAKEVTVCKGEKLSADAMLECSGDFNDYASLITLYHDGWSLKTALYSKDGYVLILEK
ncbi:MAG: hypothetical protein GXO62_01820 [Epsilonproteobacteria bacterium]|nr:hypothetical protein [Campylobacterota bacterium]